MKFAAGVVIALVAGAVQPAREVVQSRMVQLLDRYLAGYEPQLSALVADEVLLQETPPLTSIGMRPHVSRRLDSEMAFARLPGEVSWLGFRRVVKVNGQPVSSSQESLAKLLSLADRDRLAQAQLLVIQSSEHNLGLPRTINMPNLPLELLQRRYRDRFGISLGGGERIRGRQCIELTFTERAAPSIVAYGDRQDLLARMQVWIETSTGALHRARVRLSAEDAGENPQIDVEFEDHRALGMLVPTRMDERFPVDRTGAGKGRATYTNFRRFETSAKIVPQS